MFIITIIAIFLWIYNIKQIIKINSELTDRFPFCMPIWPVIMLFYVIYHLNLTTTFKIMLGIIVVIIESSILFVLPRILRNHNEVSTLLHKAIKDKDIDLIKKLISQGENINELNKLGYSPIEHAIEIKEMNIINYLLEVGIDVNIPHPCGNWIGPIGIAINNEEFELAKRLVEYGFKLNETNGKGSLPLYCAIRNGNIEMVKWLIEKELS